MRAVHQLVLNLAMVLIVCVTWVHSMTTTIKPKLLRYEAYYSWVTVDYNWINESMKANYVQSGDYIARNNVPSGVKVYKGQVYVTVPRWFNGVPCTLNRVVISGDNVPVLQPYPNWNLHTIGDCNSFQFIQAIEIEPVTGRMWIVDTGRSGIFNPAVTKNSCPAKIVLFDLETGLEISRYEFPENIVSRTTNYLNDIVLDFVDNKAAYVYITDTGTPGLVVYDIANNTSYRFEDVNTMSSEKDKPIYIDDSPFDPQVPINGIAMSSDFRYVYFSAVSGTSLYQIPTSALRNPHSDISQAIRKVGDKPSQGDGMVYSSAGNLYFGGLNDSSVYRWAVSKDVLMAQDQSEGKVTLNDLQVILRDRNTMGWVDTFAIDEKGYLWFTSSNVGRVFTGRLNFTSTEPNFRIFKSNIGETSYLTPVKSTRPIKASSPNLSSSSLSQALSLAFLLAVLNPWV